MNSFNSILAENGAYKETFPYERFLKFGPDSLTDAELLAIIIRTGTRDSSPLDIAGQIINLGQGRDRGLNSLFNLSLDELKKVRGVGEVKAVMLKCIAELSKRMASQRGSITLDCSDPSVIARFYMEKLRHEDREKVLLLCLNNRLKLIEESVVSIGTVSYAAVSPREIFIQAMKCSASNILLIHNHPGGDPSPSRADVAFTNKICESGQLLDINLIDHIIIGDMSYVSLKEKRLMWQ